MSEAALRKQERLLHYAPQESAKMRYEITNYEYLKARLAEVADDDTSRPWSDYPCLLWERGKINGYGTMRISGGIFRAHRVAYSLTHGKMILCEDDFICHYCDTPLCFRPVHLFKGAQIDNSRDMVSKKRSAWGERSGRGKLTEPEVHEIRRLSSAGFGSGRIGRQFSISKTAVRYILIGRNWAHLPYL